MHALLDWLMTMICCFVFLFIQVAGGVEDKGQDPVRDVEARPAAGAGGGPLRGAGHRALRDGLRRHQRARAMSEPPPRASFTMLVCLSPTIAGVL